MPASRSPNRAVKPAPRSRAIWPIILIGLAAVLAVIIAALPAAVITHFLPPSVSAQDLSGSIWHGSAGRISFNARDAGAIEWRLHPQDLVSMTVGADLHWVKVGFVIDCAVKIDRRGFKAHDVRGGGPIQDLQQFGVAPGWRGTADVNFSELTGDFSRPLSAVGDLKVSNLVSAQIADGADLGGYDLVFGDGAVGADGNVTARLVDTGGPLEVQTLIHYSFKDHTGMLSGTLKERADAPAALRGQLQNLSQLRGRDPQGRIPVDLEFAL
jgi:hypothetical protein